MRVFKTRVISASAGGGGGVGGEGGGAVAPGAEFDVGDETVWVAGGGEVDDAAKVGGSDKVEGGRVGEGGRGGYGDEDEEDGGDG